MAYRLHGTWADPVGLLIRWLSAQPPTTTRWLGEPNNSASILTIPERPLEHLTVTTAPPEHIRDALPLLVVSLAPGGGIDGYTRSQPVDIDLYAASRMQAMELRRHVEARLACLQGAGDEQGYVDSSTLSGFTELPHTPPDVIRLTATITLDMRPQ